MSWLLSRLWYGTTTTTSSPASSSSSPPPYHPVARQQRVIIDEQHLQSSSPSSFLSQQHEESSSSFVVSRTLPVVIADNVLGPPLTSSSSRSDGADGDVILETTPLVSQQRQWQVAAPATNGMSRGEGGGGGGEQDEQELRMPPGESSSSSSAIIDDESSTSMPVYRDVPFAILFALHCCIMAWLGIFIAPLGFDASSTNSAAQGGQQSTIDKEEEQKHHSGVIEDWNSNFNDLKEELKLEDGLTEDDMHRLESFIAQTVAYVQVYPARIFVLLILPCIVLAFGAGWLVTALGIRPCPKTMIYSSLIGCIVATFGVLVAAFVGFSHSDDVVIDHHDDTNAAGNMIFCIISLALLGGMAYSLRFYYWPRVSFCAVNLRVALIGIGRNYGTYIVAFAFAELGFVWVLYWIYVLVGTMAYTTQQCRLAHSGANFNMSDDDYDNVCDPSFFMILLFCFSLYWTNTVIMNTIQVTVAGVMATWCFDKSHADNCCSWAIIGSLVRSLTFSFGSICLASLVQGFVFLFRSIVESAKQQRQQQEYQMDGGAAACCCGGLCLCIFECLAKILEPIVECLNQLALVYCGIYGYGYLESGRRVMELLRARGWTVVLNDQLSIFVLQLMTLVVAIITGFAGVLVERFVSLYYGQYNDGSEQELPSSYIFGPLSQPALWSFGLAFFIGLWVGSIMASVLRGAVNTMIVCWADAPSAFEMEHPHLTQELATGWNAVFPSANVRPSAYGTPNLI